MLENIYPFAKEFFCLTPPNDRALDAGSLAAFLNEKGMKAAPCETTAQGIRLALETAGGDGTVIAFGSLYLAGAVRTESFKLILGS